MTQRGKRWLVALFAACALVGAGVYAWYQVALDGMAREAAPYEGPLLDQVLEPLRGPVADRATAEATLLALPEWDRDRIVEALSRLPERDHRLVAVAVARKTRERPIPRAVLARLVQDDPDGKVKEAARKALFGEPP